MSLTKTQNLVHSASHVPDTVYQFNDCRVEGDMAREATHWYYTLGGTWVAVEANNSPLTDWWDGDFDIPQEIQENFLRKDIKDIPDSGTLNWNDQDGRDYQLVR